MSGPSREEEVGKPREQKRKEVAGRRGSRWLAARLVQAEGFIEHNMPRIKASETETSQPIRRSGCCGPGSRGGITAVTLSQTLSGGDKDTERARAPEACSELGGGCRGSRRGVGSQRMETGHQGVPFSSVPWSPKKNFISRPFCSSMKELG